MKKLGVTIFIFLGYATVCLLLINIIQTYKQGDRTPPATHTRDALNETARAREQDSLSTLRHLKTDKDALKTDAATVQQAQLKQLTAPTAANQYKPTSFQITDLSGKVLFACQAQAAVFKNNSKVRIPIPCSGYGTFLKTYLTDKPEAQVLLIGSYDVHEAPQLGNERAQFVKNLLLATGIAAGQVQTASRLEHIPFVQGSAAGGITMVVIATQHSSTRDGSQATNAVRSNDTQNALVQCNNTYVENSAPFLNKTLRTEQSNHATALMCA